MKLVNRVSRRIHSRGRKRPAVHLNFELCEDRVLLTNYLVNHAADSNTGTGGNTGTLRYVLNQLPITGTAANEIDFNIPGPGVQTIRPSQPLPSITDPVFLNGESQPGFQGTPIIYLSGDGLDADGLTIATVGCQVRGLVINGFGGAGIHLVGGRSEYHRGQFHLRERRERRRRCADR